jgi:hypothetical protein
MAQVLTRPVKVTSSNKDFTMESPSGGTVVALSLDEGLYADVTSVLYNFQSKCQSRDSNFLCRFDSTTGKIVLQTTTRSWRIIFSDSDLASLLGASSSTINVTTTTGGLYQYTMPLISDHMWVSNFDYSDQEVWKPNYSELIKGNRSKNGRFVGIKTGDTLWRRSFKWVFEESEKIFKSECRTEEEVVRTLEEFILQALTTKPISGEYKTPKGLWIYYSINDLTVEEFTSTYEGIQHNYSFAPDLKTYCHLEPSAFSNIEASYQKQRDRHNVTIELHTAYYNASDFA